MTNNLTWHKHGTTRDEREILLKQKGKVLWFTGLSGSGKSTIANALAKELHSKGKLCYILDGDNIRHGLNNDLDFSSKDREENIRRISEVAKLFADCGVIVITAFISPFIKDREKARKLIGNDFTEIFIECPLEECEKRDPKGLYSKARAGEIENFTGIHQEYESPTNPEITVNSSELEIEECVNSILHKIYKSIN
jgi:adenylylsulfate kinase